MADGMTGSRHHPNTELIGQGVGNMASALFGGIPATGAIARTAANIKNFACGLVVGVCIAGCDAVGVKFFIRHIYKESGQH